MMGAGRTSRQEQPLLSWRLAAAGRAAQIAAHSNTRAVGMWLCMLRHHCLRMQCGSKATAASALTHPSADRSKEKHRPCGDMCPNLGTANKYDVSKPTVEARCLTQTLANRSSYSPAATPPDLRMVTLERFLQQLEVGLRHKAENVPNPTQTGPANQLSYACK